MRLLKLAISGFACLLATDVQAQVTFDYNPPALGSSEATRRNDLNAELDGINGAKAEKTITLTAGTGLTGGGDLSANRTFSFNYTDPGADPALNAFECRFVGAASGQIICEGDTANGFETYIDIINPTADRTVTIPDASSIMVQPTTCSNQVVTAIAATTGAVTCAGVGPNEVSGLDTGDITSGTFADARVDGSLESDEIKPLESLCVAASDETTNLSTGTLKVVWRMPYAFTLLPSISASNTGLRASVNTAQAAGTILQFDVLEGGTSIMTTTKLTIDNNEKTTTTAATAAAITDTLLADDAEMSISVVAIGTALAKGLKVCLIGNRT